VIGLRSHDHVDLGAADDLLTLGLCDAAGDRDHRGLAFVLARVFPQAADVRIDLVGRLFADVAGVEHDEVGGIGVVGRGHALRGHQLGHAVAVIDVHLAAEGLDVEGLGSGLGGCSHPGAYSGMEGATKPPLAFRPRSQ